MKHLFTSIGAITGNSPVSSLKGNGIRFSKWLLLLGLAAFTIMNSSFKKEMLQSSVERGTHFKKPVPFKGKLTASINGDQVSGTGEATHLGRFVYSGIDNGSNFPVLTGTFTLTAANGDQLYVTHTGTVEDLGGGMVRVNFENTITGGTGRFAGATGSFTSIALTNTITWTSQATFDGTITF